VVRSCVYTVVVVVAHLWLHGCCSSRLTSLASSGDSSLLRRHYSCLSRGDLYSAWCPRAVRLDGMSFVPSGRRRRRRRRWRVVWTDRRLTCPPQSRPVSSRPVVSGRSSTLQMDVARSLVATKRRATMYGVGVAAAPDRGPGSPDTGPRPGKGPSRVCRGREDS